MHAKTVTLPELGFIVGTRAALAAGVALLMADKLKGPVRRNVGLALVAIGVVTTVPAAMIVFSARRPSVADVPVM